MPLARKLASAERISLRGQVNEAVATQHCVSRRQTVGHDVRAEKADPISGIEAFVPIDEIANDVHANVALQGAGEVLHPVEVTARRIEQRPDAVLLEKRRQLPSNRIGGRRSRPAARSGLGIAPEVLVVNPLEDVAAMRAAAYTMLQRITETPRLQAKAVERRPDVHESLGLRHYSFEPLVSQVPRKVIQNDIRIRRTSSQNDCRRTYSRS